MRLTKVTERYGNDFWGEIECEFCQHKAKLDSGYEDAYYHAEVIPSMVCRSCGKTGKQWKEQQREEIINELKETAHYFGGWQELRKVIAELEEADIEAASERYFSRY